jgi:hypothetical protein
MEELASRTGGKAFYNTNDIGGSVRRAIEDTKVSYVLGFYPEEADIDGKYHELRVQVPGRKGLELRARQGYYAGDKRPFRTAKDAVLRCFLPSKTTKSSCFRSATAPFLSWTTTLTCTRRVLERMTTGAPDWAPDWATARPAESATVKSAGFMDALVEPPNYSRMEKAPLSCHYEDTNDAQIRARLSVYHLIMELN